MRAVVLRTLGDPEVLRVDDAQDPRPDASEAIVRLQAAALNHRDVWIRKGRYAGITLPIILGSDGAGEVVETGADVDSSWRGREVVIDPTLHWGHDERVQGPRFEILGLPRNGTYAELVKVPAANLHDKPRHLSFEEAAAVPLASLTAYRALVRRAQVKADETVVVTGIGGGVATCALLIGTRLGAKVYVTSGSDAKIHTARRHGAAGGVNHHDHDWPKALIAHIGDRPDIVIDGAGGETFNQALDLVKPGGRVVSYGATLGPAQNVEVRRIFWKQVNVLGSTMGSPSDFAGMLDLYAEGTAPLAPLAPHRAGAVGTPLAPHRAGAVGTPLRPIVDSVVPLDQAAEAHRRMEDGKQFGKIVLKI